jgi:uncharacterized protein YcbK (DUF882 family)
MDPDAITAFVALERSWGPLKVTSGFRCPAHNLAVGGAADSQHLLGKAFDILTSKEQQFSFIAVAKTCGFRGFGLGSTFTHCDTRANPAEWTY